MNKETWTFSVNRIIKVVDGDTIDVEVDLGFKLYHRIRIRLDGVNTPETYGVSYNSDEYLEGMKAKDFVNNELDNAYDISIVSIKKNKKGKFGRYIMQLQYRKHNYDEIFDLAQQLLKNNLAEPVEY